MNVKLLAQCNNGYDPEGVQTHATSNSKITSPPRKQLGQAPIHLLIRVLTKRYFAFNLNGHSFESFV
jgi:hypothetical protein